MKKIINIIIVKVFILILIFNIFQLKINANLLTSNEIYEISYDNFQSEKNIIFHNNYDSFIFSIEYDNKLNNGIIIKLKNKITFIKEKINFFFKKFQNKGRSNLLANNSELYNSLIQEEIKNYNKLFNLNYSLEEYLNLLQQNSNDNLNFSEDEPKQFINKIINTKINLAVKNQQLINGTNQDIMNIFIYYNIQSKNCLLCLNKHSENSSYNLNKNNSKYKLSYIDNEASNHAVFGIIPKDLNKNILIIDSSGASGDFLNYPNKVGLGVKLPTPFENSMIIINQAYQKNGTCGYISAFNAQSLGLMKEDTIDNLVNIFSRGQINYKTSIKISNNLIQKTILQIIKYSFENNLNSLNMIKKHSDDLDKIINFNEQNMNLILEEKKEKSAMKKTFVSFFPKAEKKIYGKNYIRIIEKVKVTKQQFIQITDILKLFIVDRFLNKNIKYVLEIF